MEVWPENIISEQTFLQWKRQLIGWCPSSFAHLILDRLERRKVGDGGVEARG